MKRLLWLRHETKPFEKRVALTPDQISILLKKGHDIVVERSPNRIFSDTEYEKTGARMMEPNSWIDLAPKEATIFGLKELEKNDFPLEHRHIHFAHVFKKQQGAYEYFKRMQAGGGLLYDLEYLVDRDQKRIAAFGEWAGFSGAALGLDLWIAQKKELNYNDHGVVTPWEDCNQLVGQLKDRYTQFEDIPPKVLIIGAFGRSGRGAQRFFKRMGIPTTNWGSSDTKGKTEISEILDYDILVNCALMKKSVGAWLTPKMLHRDNIRLTVLSDVGCDPTGPCNTLPIYDQITTMDVPALYIEKKGRPLAVTAIDHLPSLLPRESSEDYALQLFPYILQYMEGKIEGTVWDRALTSFYKNYFYHLEKEYESEENSSINARI